MLYCENIGQISTNFLKFHYIRIQLQLEPPYLNISQKGQDLPSRCQTSILLLLVIRNTSTEYHYRLILSRRSFLLFVTFLSPAIMCDSSSVGVRSKSVQFALHILLFPLCRVLAVHSDLVPLRVLTPILIRSSKSLLWRSSNLYHSSLQLYGVLPSESALSQRSNPLYTVSNDCFDPSLLLKLLYNTHMAHRT